MELQIILEIEEQEVAVKEARSLKRWIDDEEIDDIQVELKRKELAKDEATAGVAEGILAVTLAAPSVILLAKAIHVWLKERTKQKVRKLKIKAKNGEKEIEIETENAGNSEEHIVNLIKKVLD